MNTVKPNISNQVKIALLSSIAFILSFFSTSLPIFPQFLKMDIGDLPEIIAWMQLGLPSAVITSLIKNILHLFVTQSAGIGELINFLISTIFLFSLNAVYKRTNNLKISFILSVLVIALASVAVNNYIMFPLYRLVLNINAESIVSLSYKFNPLIKNLGLYFALIILPFNLIKFTAISMISYSFKYIQYK